MYDDHGIGRSLSFQICYACPYRPYVIDHYHTLSGEILMVNVIDVPLTV